jgi:hypothetical protein
VCGDILEEAQEQESNEALLAYFFLWQGGDTMGFVVSPSPSSKADLAGVQGFLLCATSLIVSRPSYCAVPKQSALPRSST